MLLFSIMHQENHSKEHDQIIYYVHILNLQIFRHHNLKSQFLIHIKFLKEILQIFKHKIEIVNSSSFLDK